jgi:glycolate oxidase FAD binding subunit
VSTTLETLPLSDTKTPETQEDLAAVVREAVGSETAIYPIGGGTSLEYGMPVTQKGWGVSLAGLKRCVDYPARDMTITVEAGITMAELTATLATENQRLPIDAAQAETATLGGVVATNFSGPRRFGSGTMRDYVIGISAVDGRGTLFKGGGRVVKNVAGYDFCKLLTGSLGTLAIISQVTLKVKPIPEASAFLACDVQSFEQAEKLLAALITSQTTPAAVELLSGPAWDDAAELGPLSRGAVTRLLVGLEGTRAEVHWMLEQLASEWQALGVQAYRTIPPETAPEVWRRLTEFPVEGDAPLVLKVNVRPSAVAGYMRLLQEVDAQCSIQAQAGNGVLRVRMSQFTYETPKLLVARLQPAAIAAGGQAVVWSSAGGSGLTRQAMWGAPRDEFRVMQAVKQQFDPHGLLNPGRFFFVKS